MKKKSRLIILVIITALAILAVLLIRMFKKSSYTRDQDVEIDQEALETEEVQIHAEDLYHLETVMPVSAALAENTYTLLVVGAEQETETEAESPETASSEMAEAVQTEENVSGRNGSRLRSDAEAIILMTINHNRKECFFETLHTNLYAEIPGHGGGRLGNAWAVGGGPLLSETIRTNYGITVDNYAAISLREVARIIGIEEFADLNISEDGLEVVEKLVYSLNAQEAVKVASYISSLLPYVTHNIDDAQMLRIILQLPRIVGYYSEKDRLPYADLVTEADGYLVPEIGATAARLQHFIYGEEVSEEATEAMTE